MALTFGVALDFGSRLRPLHQQLERQARLLRAAEDAGFELVAAGESSSAGSFHLPNALQVLAAISPRTRLRLCTGITLLPAWDVWKLALDAAQLDQLSGGRLILGVGIGSAARREQAGWSADAAGQTVDEYLLALRALWSGATEYHGSQVHVDGRLPIQPASPQGPPIWVGGAIRRSAVRAARYSQGWYGGVNFGLSALPRMVSWYRSALAAEGKAVTEGAVVVNRLALAAKTSTTVAEQTERYLSESLRPYASANQSLPEVIDEIALVGTPDHVVAQSQRYHDVGVTHLFARLSLDEMPIEVAEQTIDLYGRDVIPRLR
jgi:alkanesulfonate monooxygenase SsuD/methylene tetrahydromethanopterin reductase-like flavin-dependent oxidoreductase (luciferase family)